jgi:hypothetical protein
LTLDWLKGWIDKGLAWIDTQDFPAPLVDSRKSQIESPNTLLVAKDGGCTEVTMAWLAGQVFYTLDGSDPRLSGGDLSPRRWSTNIPCNSRLEGNSVPVRAASMASGARREKSLSSSTFVRK